MKKFLIIIGFILCLSILGIGWWNYFKQKQINQYTRAIINEKFYLEDSFKNLLSTDTICIENIWVEHKEQRVKLSNIISFPCLVIYLPSTEEEICGSCIKYALNSVKIHFDNILKNNHICLISASKNPAIKKRIYQKDCYVTQTALLNVPQTNIPYYFILTKEGYVRHLFYPNGLHKKYTIHYLNFLDSIYQISKY